MAITGLFLLFYFLRGGCRIESELRELDRASLRLFRPVKPMLAQTAEDMAGASAGLIFVNGVGAIVGPLAIGWMLGVFGPAGYSNPPTEMTRMVRHWLDCVPCKAAGTRLVCGGDYTCMKLITGQEIMAHARELIREYEAA